MAAAHAFALPKSRPFHIALALDLSLKVGDAVLRLAHFACAFSNSAYVCAYVFSVAELSKECVSSVAQLCVAANALRVIEEALRVDDASALSVQRNERRLNFGVAQQPTQRRIRSSLERNDEADELGEQSGMTLATLCPCVRSADKSCTTMGQTLRGGL